MQYYITLPKELNFLKNTKQVIKPIIIIILVIVVIRIAASFIFKDIWKENAIFFQKEVLNIDSNVKEVNFNDLTPFEWDKVYFFRPYVSKESIYKTIGYEWDTVTSSVDGMLQVVFLNDDKVVGHIYGYPDKLKYDISVDSKGSNGYTLYHYEDHLNVQIKKTKYDKKEYIELQIVSP